MCQKMKEFYSNYSIVMLTYCPMTGKGATVYPILSGKSPLSLYTAIGPWLLGFYFVCQWLRL